MCAGLGKFVLGIFLDFPRPRPSPVVFSREAHSTHAMAAIQKIYAPNGSSFGMALLAPLP